MSMTGTDIVGEIKEHLARITPGPWKWGGNTAYGDVEITARGPFGTQSVLRMLNVKRAADDWRISDIDEVMVGGDVDELREDFLFDANGDARTDPFISFNVEGRLVPAKDLAIYEVCREATSRHDRRVYREDVVGVRNDDASFMVAAPSYVQQLLRIVEEQADEITRLRGGRLEWHDAGGGTEWAPCELGRFEVTGNDIVGHALVLERYGEHSDVAVMSVWFDDQPSREEAKELASTWAMAKRLQHA